MESHDLKAIFEYAQRRLSVEPIAVDGGVVAAVPKGDGGRELVSLEKFAEELRGAPKRRKGVASVATLDSFIDLVNRHKDESSAIFGDFRADGGRLLGVIDYHQLDGSPRFGKHGIAYPFPIAPEWSAWLARDGKPMGQGDWGAFVEDRIADLAAPLDQESSTFEGLFQTKIGTPAEIIQLSRGMALTVEARVKNVHTLQSGEAEIIYEEVHSDGRGERLRVPGLFVLRVPFFVGGPPMRIIARLRYRKSDAKLSWFYQLYRADVALREAMEVALLRAAAETGLPVYQGLPEA